MGNILFALVCVAVLIAAAWTIFKKQGSSPKGQIGGSGGGGESSSGVSRDRVNEE